MLSFFDQYSFDLPDAIFAMLLIVILPILSGLSDRHLRAQYGNNIPADVMQRNLTVSMIMQWILTIIALSIWFVQARNLADIGLASRETLYGLSPLYAQIAGGIAIVYFVVFPVLMVFSAKTRESFISSARKADVEDVLPKSASEMRRFTAISITAGVCEEIIYRGYLIWFFTNFMALEWAALVSLACFVSVHLYQSASGLIKVTMMGGLLTLWVLFTGSLWLAIIIHALVDFSSGLASYIAHKYPSDTSDSRESGETGDAKLPTQSAS